VLPARLDDYERERDPHFYGVGQTFRPNRRLGSNLIRPRDLGAQGESWRAVLLDQFRRRGVNFFGA
jgi:hypothetical protein